MALQEILMWLRHSKFTVTSPPVGLVGRSAYLVSGRMNQDSVPHTTSTTKEAENTQTALCHLAACSVGKSSVEESVLLVKKYSIRESILL